MNPFEDHTCRNLFLDSLIDIWEYFWSFSEIKRGRKKHQNVFEFFDRWKLKSWKSRNYLSETRRSSIYYTAPFLAQSDAWYDISANFHALHAVSSSIASRHKVQLNSHMTRVLWLLYTLQKCNVLISDIYNAAHVPVPWES